MLLEERKIEEPKTDEEIESYQQYDDKCLEVKYRLLLATG